VPKRLLLIASAALGALAAVAVIVVSSGASTSRTTVHTGRALGRLVLVNAAGHTLYSLSAENAHHFICTNQACTSLWHPVTIKRGSKPTGAKALGTARRPGGATQVTYRGRPLYAFAEDHKPGQAKGEGFRDVGTWHVAAVKAASQQHTQAPAPAPSPSYGGY
jgi:predicted lipoprotein with Yx(FWY)xxD motif